MSENKEVCLEESYNKSIEELEEKLLNEDQAYQLSEFYKVFGDITRIRILHLLSLKEICVHEISAILDISQSAVSHQLKVLRQNKLVKPRKEGKHVFYSLDDEHVLQIFKNGIDHINE
ncbi:DNA-binding transcriptional ArsR family regulator [Bacilli bacterium PM5-3]|nr:DNA-binding transcriptional ArsR family regulator [Bacilli bacterium PM5-3]MDH6604149.1 DNA-binding transcriptional ArsR family regulator [Bacilli bacterium PM5-9]